jgi:hypothetical protein
MPRWLLVKVENSSVYFNGFLYCSLFNFLNEYIYFMYHRSVAPGRLSTPVVRSRPAAAAATRKTCKVTLVKKTRNGGLQELRVRHLPLTEDQATVEGVTDLARREFADDNIVIVGRDGLIYEDTDGTRGGIFIYLFI